MAAEAFIISAAVPIFVNTLLSLATNENQNTVGKKSIFTYASILPQLELKKNTWRIDTNLKLILAMTVAEIEKMVGYSKIPEWMDVVSVMEQSVLFEKCEGSSRYGTRTYTRDSFNFCKFNGEPDKGTVADIKKWFMDVLETVDPELKELTGVLQKDALENLTSIVASTGSSVDSLSTVIRRSDYHELTLADIGLIRYPSYEKPRAKIFRLKIKSWRHCRRVVAFESNNNGLTVEIDSREYVPREYVISHMRDHVLTEAELEKLCEKADNILIKM